MNISTALGFIVGILIVNTISMFFQLDAINREVERIESHLFKIQSHTLTLKNKE